MWLDITFLVVFIGLLLWMSMSYGFTNFVWIWLWITKDKNLFAGYLILIIWNLRQTKKSKRVNIPWLLAIGLLVQFGWEVGLYLGGIRSATFTSITDIIAPMIINSLLETNLGMPYIFLVFIAVSRRFTESLKRGKTKLFFMERVEENNAENVKDKENISEYLA